MGLTSIEIQKPHVQETVAHRWTMPAVVKHALVYFSVFIVVSFIIGLLFSSSWHNGIASVADRFVFAGIFLLIGLAHHYCFSRMTSYLKIRSGNMGMIYLLILSLLIVDALMLLFFFSNVKAYGMSVAAGCAFALPYVVNECRIRFLGIEPKQYKNWVIPADTVPDTRKSLLLNSIFFRINIRMKYYDKAATSFSVNLAPHLNLSTVFSRFLYDQHDTIEVKDERNQPYAWRFSVKSFLGRRILDPALSLEKNSVKEGDIILIERIKI